MPVLTKARSGLARSGATRSGYPIAVGRKVPLYALSGVARSGATRSNYHSGRLFLAIAGAQIAGARADAQTGILLDSLSITDTLNQTPNTARCRVRGLVPATGAPVVIVLGSVNNLRREFGGQVLSTDLYVLGDNRANTQAAVNLIDYTWGLDKRKVSGYYTGSATTIAQSLVATYAPGYTAVIEAGLPTVDGGITFTNEDLTVCLTRLFKRVGGNWFCDYDKVVRGFLIDTSATDPTPLNAIHPSLRAFKVTTDLSQVVTRVYVEGGGVQAAATCAAGETRLPLNGDSWWFDPAGGVVVAGPQRIGYTGVSGAGGGGLVGPGAAPSGAPGAALASGAGLETGGHLYAVTFVTAAGESLAGPTRAIAVGLLAAPVSAPTAAADPTVGAGPNPGSHDYAVTFVTSSGETTPGPSVTKATAETAAPESAPTPGVATAGGSVTVGTHEYAVTFVTSIGETMAGPISAQGSTGVTAAPGIAPTAAASGGAGVEVGVHDYAVTFVTAAGETTPGPARQVSTVAAVSAPSTAPNNQFGNTYRAAGLMVNGALYGYKYTFWDGGARETTPSPAGSYRLFSPGDNAMGIEIASLETPPAGFQRRFYRTVGDGATYKLLPSGQAAGQFSEITGSGFYIDIVADATLGAAAPGGNTTALQQVALTAIPTGAAGAGVTSRQIYRRFNGTGTFKLLTTLPNNSTTTYTDTTANASLGAAAPSANTATLNTIPLTAIPRGTSEVTSRKLYRRSGGLGLKFLAEIPNNVATTYSDTAANASLGAAPPATSTALLQRIALAAIPTGSALVTSRKIYRTTAGGAQLKFLATLADNTTTTFLDTVTDASLGANVPVTNTATANQVALSAIPIGAAAVTARKVYRTVAGGAQLKLLTTLADNTTTTAADSAADASLGANVPVSDTSGLTQPDGQVMPGATTLQVSSIGAFPASGWAVIGNGQQVIRYTSIVGNVLMGIPSSGAGAIAAAIAYNSTVTSPPQLIGIPSSGTGSILYPILQGDEVNLFVQVDDVAAQAVLAALIGGDGIQEDYIQDRRLAKPECVARGQAQLALRGSPEVTITYECRDINTRAGRTVRVNLGPPFNLADVPFLIQQVTETPADTRPAIPPLYQVTASSTRFGYDDLLRLARGKD